MVSVTRALVTRGRSVTVFDMPARGKSDGRRTTLPQMARAIAAVVGHSLGAAAAFSAYATGSALRSRCARRFAVRA